MKAKPVKYVIDKGYVQVSVEQATHIKLFIPGPTGEIYLPVQIKGTRAGTGNWTWNGSVDRPTVRPSVFTKSGHFMDSFDPKKDSCWCKYNAENPDRLSGAHCYACHSWVNDGTVQFLPDCSHEFRNQTLPLLDIIEPEVLK